MEPTQDEVRAELEARRNALAQRLARVQRHRRREDGPLEADAQEQAQERENDEVLDGLDDQARAEVAALDAALERLAAGTYGECARCGDPIAPARLRARPTALRCIACETAVAG